MLELTAAIDPIVDRRKCVEHGMSGRGKPLINCGFQAMVGANHNGAKIIIGTEIAYETQHENVNTKHEFQQKLFLVFRTIIVQERKKFSRRKSDDEATGKTKGGYSGEQEAKSCLMRRTMGYYII